MQLTPLSPYSIPFYIEQQLDPERFDYNMLVDQELRGDVDVERLCKALDRFIQDHILLNSKMEIQSNH